MISCTWRMSLFDAGQARHWFAEWGDGATIEQLTPVELRGLPDVRVLRNGIPVPPEDWDKLLNPGDYVEWSLDPGELFTVGAALAGQSSLMAGGFVLGEFATATAGALAFTANLTFALGITSLLGALLKQKPPKPGEEDSPTYAFGGIASNPAHAGAAYPVLYGRPRVAGPIINVYTEALTDSDEFLNVLVMLAGHEVVAIGDKTEDGGPFTDADGNLPEGLQINGEPAENFHDVEVYVRLGTSDQLPIPGHSLPVLTEDVSRTLRESEDVAGAEQTPGVYAVDDAEIEAWDTPVSHTTYDEADEFNILIRFPFGLYGIDSAGSLQDATAEFQVRYRRATNGGPVGEYVVLPPFTLTAHRNTGFTVSFARQFLDPATYVEPTRGFYLDLAPSATAHAETAGSITLATQTADETEMSVICWLRPTNVSPYDAPYFLVRYLNANRGFGFSVEEEVGFSGQEVPKLQVTLGNGTTTTNAASDLDKFLSDQFENPPEGTQGFTMLGFTYKANAYEGGGNRLRFYCNGKQIDEENIAFEALWPTSAQVIVGAANGSGASNVDGQMDEVLIYKRELSQVEMNLKFNGGAPFPASASETDIVAGWHMDSTVTGTQVDDFVGANNLLLEGSAAISSGSNFGPVFLADEGDPLKDRFLVEVQRINAEEDTTAGQDQADWSSIQLVGHDELSYPGVALLGVRVKASDQLQGLPQITVPVKGAKVPSWDGEDVLNPFITHSWNRNPAWILAHAATDLKLGLGDHWTIADVDWQELLDFAEFCDELIILDEEAQPVYDPPGGGAGDAIEVEDASTATILHPLFTNGLIRVRVNDENWPATWPPGFGDTAEGDCEWFFALTGDGMSASGVPAIFASIEDVPLACGAVEFAGSGTGKDHFILLLHPPTDPGVDDSHNPATGETIEVQRYEHRMECDLVFDRIDFPGWEALRTIAASARAQPVKKGGQISAFFDAPRDVDNMLGMGNTVAHTFATIYSGIADRPNVIEAEFLDRQRNYERTAIVEEHPSFTDPTAFINRRVTQENIEGITRRSQVKRHLRWKLNTYHLMRRMYEAQGGPDMLAIQPGMRIAVSHDVPGWGVSGRLRGDSGTDSVVKLDRDVVLLSGATYQVQVRDQGAGLVETRTISTGAGSYAAGTSLAVSVAFSFVPTDQSVYHFGATGRTGMDFLVRETSIDATTLQHTLRATQYDAQVYEDAYGEVSDTVISNLALPEV